MSAKFSQRFNFWKELDIKKDKDNDKEKQPTKATLKKQDRLTAEIEAQERSASNGDCDECSPSSDSATPESHRHRVKKRTGSRLRITRKKDKDRKSHDGDEEGSLLDARSSNDRDEDPSGVVGEQQAALPTSASALHTLGTPSQLQGLSLDLSAVSSQNSEITAAVRVRHELESCSLERDATDRASEQIRVSVGEVDNVPQCPRPSLEQERDGIEEDSCSQPMHPRGTEAAHSTATATSPPSLLRSSPPPLVQSSEATDIQLNTNTSADGTSDTTTTATAATTTTPTAAAQREEHTTSTIAEESNSNTNSATLSCSSAATSTKATAAAAAASSSATPSFSSSSSSSSSTSTTSTRTDPPAVSTPAVAVSQTRQRMWRSRVSANTNFASGFAALAANKSAAATPSATDDKPERSTEPVQPASTSSSSADELQQKLSALSAYTLASNLSDVYKNSSVVTVEKEERRVTGNPRENIINEIIDTEKHYVRDMEIMRDVYLIPLREKNLLTKDELNSIFGNVELIITVNRQLLEALVIEVEKQHSDIGAAFLRVGQYLKVYSQYCNNQAVASRLVESLRASNLDFDGFLRYSSHRPESRKRSLESLMIMPVQRVCRYPLLLASLLKKTPESHVDFVGLKEAHALIEEAVIQIEETKQRMEAASRLYDIQAKIEGLSSQGGLIQPHRRLLYDSPIRAATGSSKIKAAYYFLFNDLLLICSAPSKSSHYQLRAYLPLEQCLINPDPAKAGKAQYCFEVVHVNAGTQQKVLLESASKAAKEMLIAQMQDVINALRK
eukprot:CAMPEP_0177636664 /NCGR_PEP_ID=MMETSP0447-20121125/4557_1 /TAXON_ID=0 /ORGANISM="Stygamoeba regulata, Strain BSH-02190019" /LENGTH=787 /DNA_ID=CAMNT_0019138537 /DNA_START=40 /DNA_END=2403 /DNA_ORIENTATION=-